MKKNQETQDTTSPQAGLAGYWEKAKSQPTSIKIMAVVFLLLVIYATFIRPNLNSEPPAQDTKATEAIIPTTAPTTSSPAATSEAPTPQATPLAEANCRQATDVDMSDPDDLATAYGEIAYCMTGQDRNMSTAALRAEALMTPRLQELTRGAAESVRAANGAQFAEANQKNAHTVPTVQLVSTHGVGVHEHAHSGTEEQHEELPAELEGMVSRTIRVSWGWQTPEGENFRGGINVILLIMLPQPDGTYRIDAASINYAE